MKVQRILAMLVLLAAFGLQAQAQAQVASKQWLHVRVDSAKKGGENVKVNVPLALAETVLGMVKEKNVSSGKIKIEDKNFTAQDLRKIWNAVKAEGNAEFVTVQTQEVNLRVALEGAYLVVRTDETSPSQVQITLPTKVVDALLSGNDDELDLLAAIRALQETDSKEIVSIKDKETSVKVWIDDRNISE